MVQEYNLVIVTPHYYFAPVTSIKINLPILLPIGTRIELTEKQEKLLTDKILQSPYLNKFKLFISGNGNNNIDIINNATNDEVIRNLTGVLLHDSEQEIIISDNKDFFLDCFSDGLWIIGYEFYVQDNEINILTTQDYDTYEKLILKSK